MNIDAIVSDVMQQLEHVETESYHEHDDPYSERPIREYRRTFTKDCPAKVRQVIREALIRAVAESRTPVAFASQ